jgi:type VI secretion system secreted protein Hcp
MAVDMFIKIGDIKGESTDSKHKDEIDVLSWSWGASQSGSAHMGGGGGSGKVQVQDLTLTKYIDAASPTLLKMCCDGSHIKACKLTVRKAGKDPLEYLKISLEDAIVTSISTGGSGGQDRLTENVTLNFARFGVTYTPQTPTGAAAPSVSGGWDIAQNKPFDAK